MQYSTEAPDLTKVAEDLIQVPEVYALWISRMGLVFPNEIYLGIGAEQPTQILYDVCTEVDRVLFDDVTYDTRCSVETKYVCPEAEVTLFRRDEITLSSGIENLREFISEIPAEGPLTLNQQFQLLGVSRHCNLGGADENS